MLRTTVPNSIRVRVEFVMLIWTYTALLNMVIEFGTAVLRSAQKSKPHIFCNNFVYCQPIFITFGIQTLEEIGNRSL